jgi:hypothetical protein
LNALRNQYGSVIIGPSTNIAGMLTEEKGKAWFVNKLRRFDLRLNRFYVGDKGKIKRGSLVAEFSGGYFCSACGAQRDLSSDERSALEEMYEGKLPCPCGKGYLHWRKMSEVLSNEDPAVELMFDFFAGSHGIPANRVIVPRVWGVYPIDQCPDQWVPEAEDHKALSLAERLEGQGKALRPFKTAMKAQSPALLGLILEGTVTGGGKPCLMVGCLAQSDIQGMLSAEYGYTMRLDPRSPVSRPDTGGV